jgi:hypothetical protein
VPVNAEITFLLFKERRPFKLKKEYPSEQWQIISFRLIPLKTPVSFRWTAPLNRLQLPLRIASKSINMKLFQAVLTAITKFFSSLFSKIMRIIYMQTESVYISGHSVKT